MPKFLITYGVGGGYNDITKEVIEAENLDSANQDAYEASIQVFDGYSICEEHNDTDDLSEEEYQELYHEELERWCSYHAEPVDDSFQLHSY